MKRIEKLLKARTTKYYKRTGSPGKYRYYYTKDEWDNRNKLVEFLLSFFGSSKVEEVAKNEYEDKNIEETGISFEDFKLHFEEYFKNKEKWDKRFSGSGKSTGGEKSKKKKKETKKKKDKKKSKINTKIMRLLYNLYGAESEKQKEIKQQRAKELVRRSLEIKLIPFKERSREEMLALEEEMKKLFPNGKERAEIINKYAKEIEKEELQKQIIINKEEPQKQEFNNEKAKEKDALLNKEALKELESKIEYPKNKNILTEEEQKARDYFNAKPSEVENAGEDVWGAARHNFSTYSLGELESQGVAKKYINKKMLLGDINLDKEERLKAGDDINKILFLYIIKRILKNIPGDNEEEREVYYEFVKKIEKLDSEIQDGYDFKKALKDYLKTTVEGGNAYYSLETRKKRKLYESALGRAYVVASDGYTSRSGKKINEIRYMAQYSWQTYTAATGTTHKIIDKVINGVKRRSPDWENPITVHYSDEERKAKYEKRVLELIDGKINKKTGKKKSRTKPPEIKQTGEIIRKGGKKYEGSTKQLQKKLVDDFGFRALQYGNSMTDEERAYHTQKTLEAFSDLGEILGVDPEKISMKGRLAMAFGARGKAGAVAHYEPAQKIINLTRYNGFGSLAHEWGHFFDNVLSIIDHDGDKKKANGKMCSTGDFNKEKGVITYSDIDSIPDGEILDFKGHNFKFLKSKKWFEKIDKHGKPTRRYYKFYKSNIQELKAYTSNRAATKVAEISNYVYKKTEKYLKEYTPYWNRKEEVFARAFETYIAEKLNKAGRKNTYLSALSKVNSSDVYPSGEVREKANKMFDELFEMVRAEKILEKAIRFFIKIKK